MIIQGQKNCDQCNSNLDQRGRFPQQVPLIRMTIRQQFIRMGVGVRPKAQPAQAVLGGAGTGPEHSPAEILWSLNYVLITINR